MKVFTTLKFGKIEIENVPFLISEDGKIIMNCETDHFLKGYVNNNGYKIVSVKNKRIPVHKMVALAFLGERPEGYEVDHIDRNKLNNHYKNLRYVTRSEQMKNRDYTNISRLMREKAKIAHALACKKIMLKRDNETVFFDSVKDAILYISEQGNNTFLTVKSEFYKHMKSDKKICGYEIFYDGEAQNDD